MEDINIPQESQAESREKQQAEDVAREVASQTGTSPREDGKMVLRTENLVKKYRQRTVVNHVSIDVTQGEIVGLLGPNGAGKTTTFYMTTGLIVPNEGQIYLNDMNITKFPVYRRAQHGIGYLAQEASVFRKMSVENNIRSILEMTPMSKEEQRDKLESLIAEFRLEKVRKNLGDQLSGGERRRTEIARCLAINPKFIMLDEPFAGVDPIAVEDIQEVVYKLKSKNIGILITDHNARYAIKNADDSEGYPVLFYSGSLSDITINTIIGGAASIMAKQSIYQNQIMLMTELLFPICNYYVRAYDYLTPNDVEHFLHEKSLLSRETDRGMRPLPFDRLSCSIVEAIDPINAEDAKEETTFYITTGKQRGIPTKLASIMDISRQTIEKTIKAGNIYTARNMAITAINEMTNIRWER